MHSSMVIQQHGFEVWSYHKLNENFMEWIQSHLRRTKNLLELEASLGNPKREFRDTAVTLKQSVQHKLPAANQ